MTIAIRGARLLLIEAGVLGAFLLWASLAACAGSQLSLVTIFGSVSGMTALLPGLFTGVLDAALPVVLTIFSIPSAAHGVKGATPAELAPLLIVSVFGVPISFVCDRVRRDAITVARMCHHRFASLRGRKDCITCRQRTATKEVKRGLHGDGSQYLAAFHTGLDGMAISSLATGRYLEVNDAFLNLSGFRRDEVIGKSAKEVGLWLHYQERQEVTESLLRDWSIRNAEFRFKRKNGQIFWGTLSASTVVVNGECCLLTVMRDTSAWKMAQEEIRKLGMYDSLTALPNRRLLRDRLSKSIAFGARNHRKKAALFLDLDDFKRLNDNLGHQAGDLLLREVASRIHRCIRAVDTVARLGGDEFVILLEDLSQNAQNAAAEAEAFTEKITNTLDQPFQLRGHECVSSCSIGITIFGDGNEDVDEILQQAEIAMYQAKAAGRNTIRFFAPELQETVNSRAILEEELRAAVKNGLLSVYYQPQVEDGRLIGAEALVRWNHPRLGLLAASEFIDLAEDTRLILPLGNWVLESVCKQIAEWSKSEETARITVAVNISALQLRRGDFVNLVSSALGQSGANPKKLKLELTETVLMDRVEDVISKMTALKSMGLSFSVDDFGTGYSSLAYLKRFPLDQVKIDRSFVRDIPSDVGSGAIAQAIISLSKAMGLTVIAEGVETEQQRSFLAALGCDSCQGYLYGLPVPPDQFEPLARSALMLAHPPGCTTQVN